MYKVESPDYPSINSVSSLYETSVTRLLRQYNVDSDLSVSNAVHVQQIKLNTLGQVQVNFTNGDKFLYDHLNLKQWKQLPPNFADGPEPSQVLVKPGLGNYEGSVDKVNLASSQDRKTDATTLSSLIDILSV